MEKLIFLAVSEIICSDMELENLLLNSTVWVFQTSTFYTHAARQRLMRDVDGVLRRMRAKRLRWVQAATKGVSTPRVLRCGGPPYQDRELAHQMASGDGGSEGAHLHPGILDFTY
jgi:hypothetical protein